MANHKSAKKRIRQTARKNTVNTERRSKVKTAIRNVTDAISKKEKDNAAAALKNAESQIMRGLGKGIFKKNTAARMVSKLSNQVKKAFA